MPRKNNKKNRKPQTSEPEFGTFWTFPDLHQQVCAAVEDSGITPWYEDDNDSRFSKQWSTSIIAAFVCNNSNCSKKRWTSKKVAIIIKGYANEGYSATVYNQRCESCDSLGGMILDEDTYVERVAHRLKVWAGLGTGQVYGGQKKGPPHKEELCEACKLGLCRAGNSSLLSSMQSWSI